MNVSLNLTTLILHLIRTIRRAVNPMKKNKQLNVRLPNDLREELERACEVVGLDAATVTRACLQAFVDQVTHTGEIRLPLAIVPKKSTPTFPLTARAPHVTPSLNEAAPKLDAVRALPPAPAPKFTPTRAVMREIAKKTPPKK